MRYKSMLEMDEEELRRFLGLPPLDSAEEEEAADGLEEEDVEEEEISVVFKEPEPDTRTTREVLEEEWDKYFPNNAYVTMQTPVGSFSYDNEDLSEEPKEEVQAEEPAYKKWLDERAAALKTPEQKTPIPDSWHENVEAQKNQRAADLQGKIDWKNGEVQQLQREEKSAQEEYDRLFNKIFSSTFDGMINGANGAVEAFTSLPSLSPEHESAVFNSVPKNFQQAMKLIQAPYKGVLAGGVAGGIGVAHAEYQARKRTAEQLNSRDKRKDEKRRGGNRAT